MVPARWSTRPRAEGEDVSIRGKAFIAGIYEHPLREIPDRTTSQIHAEVAAGALADAGLTIGDAAEAIAAGKCQVALVTLAGKPRTSQMFGGGRPGGGSPTSDGVFEGLW